MIDDDLVRAHRERALSPDHPVLRGSAQNPDVYFQGRETVNPYYLACPTIVQNAMDKFAGAGRPPVSPVRVRRRARRRSKSSSSWAPALRRCTRRWKLSLHKGRKVGVLKVRLYRPFSVEHFLQALPKTVKSIAVLDRTKEPGCIGEPLYQDVVTALMEGFTAAKAPMAAFPKVIGGRYGLSSKEFTPAMVVRVFRRTDQVGTAKSFHHRHQRRRHPHQPRLRS